VTTTCLADRTAPGEQRPVADGLTDAGLDVRATGDGEGRLDIAWPGARCTLAVGDCGSADLIAAPDRCGPAADPASVAVSVVEAVTPAMSLLRQVGTGRAAHG